MKIFPAIDLLSGKAVRLYKGDYDKVTVYNDDPSEVALAFEKAGATCMHLVDLDGAKTGGTPNLEVIKSIISKTNLFVEVGGGIRSLEVIEKYVSAGVGRVILGTAAVTNPELLAEALAKYGDKVAVGVDLKDGYVAIKGWTEKSELLGFDFMKKLQDMGVSTVICTDISKDGAMMGTNHALYRELTEKLDMQVVASGGVSSIEDVKKLRALGIYVAIIGKAYYTGDIILEEALEVAK